MTDINRPHNTRASAHRSAGRSLIMQLPPQDRRSRPAAFGSGQRDRLPSGSNLDRTVDGVGMPVAGLWNIPSGSVAIELAVPRFLRRAVRAQMRLKQGMIAIADDPTHSTAHLSLDAASLRTGDAVRDLRLHRDVLGADSNSTIPVRLSIVEHCGGPNWKAHGWITIRGAATPIDLDVVYEGVHSPTSAARFRATATLPLRDILGGGKGFRRRFLTSRSLRISIEIHAERVRTSVDHHSRLHQRRNTASLS